MIRREKINVLPDLPPKLKQVVPLECEAVEFATYESADSAFHVWVKDSLARKSAVEATNQIEHLKQLAYLAKRNSLLNWMKEFLSSGKKLIVFGIHLHVLDDIEREFKGISVRVDGGIKPEDRKAIEQKFQTDPAIKLFIGQVVAAGVALTLTAAADVAFLELPWTNADVDQPSDRAHRIGQKDTVNIYFLIANGTVENKIIAHLDANRAVVKKLLDGREVEDTDLLSNLLNEYLQEKEQNSESYRS
jgi:SWI/SNF-related matrix-associated actin-dependent regulator 1 of chromatin subfamily A